MAIQHRRGAYADFDPTKMKPGEIAFVQSGDPLVSDGRAVYVCFTSGDVRRMATQEELSEYDAVAEAAAEAAAEAKADVLTLKGEVDTAKADTLAAQTAAEDAQEAAEDAQAAAEAAQTAINTAISGFNTTVQNGIAAVQAVVDDFDARTDIGSDMTDANGSCYVYLSQDLQALLGASGTYCVFLQEEGPGKLYVSQKTSTYFLVEGTESLNFVWELKVLTTTPANGNGGGE